MIATVTCRLAAGTHTPSTSRPASLSSHAPASAAVTMTTSRLATTVAAQRALFALASSTLMVSPSASQRGQQPLGTQHGRWTNPGVDGFQRLRLDSCVRTPVAAISNAAACVNVARVGRSDIINACMQTTPRSSWRRNCWRIRS